MMMAVCKYPVLIRNPAFKGNPTATQYMKVPCGKCVNCLSSKSRQWIFRLKQEMKVSSSAFFVTLTYADENLVWTSSGIATLFKSDFQNFMKRLRKAHSKRNHIPLRYFACGEYGSKTKRPHYHAIIFNADYDLIEKAWSVDGEPLGHVHIGTVTEDSIAYNTKYIMKVNSEWQDQFSDDPEFQREFSLKSKGIGKSYTENKNIRKYHKQRLEQNYVQDEKGFRVSMPRYYKDKIFDEDEREQMRMNTVHEVKKLDWEKYEQMLKDEQEGINTFENELSQSQYEDYLVYKRLKQKQSKL